jgi:hypothetical protein
MTDIARSSPVGPSMRSSTTSITPGRWSFGSSIPGYGVEAGDLLLLLQAGDIPAVSDVSPAGA